VEGERGGRGEKRRAGGKKERRKERI